MSRIREAGSSAALVIAVVALVAALGGGAVAGVTISKLNKSEKKQVKKLSKKQARKLDKKIELLPGPQGEQGPVGPDGLNLFGEGAITAPVSDQTDKEYAEALAAAPEVPLFSKGQLALYGKCFEILAGEKYAVIVAETSAAGAILRSESVRRPAVELAGDDDYLDPGTPEEDRVVGRANYGSGSFRSRDLDRGSFAAIAPDGTALNGLLSAGAGAGGAYGSSPGCVFSGFAAG